MLGVDVLHQKSPNPQIFFLPHQHLGELHRGFLQTLVASVVLPEPGNPNVNIRRLFTLPYPFLQRAVKFPLLLLCSNLWLLAT
jgi:hypothetical protein